MRKVHQTVLADFVDRLPAMGYEVRGVHLAGGRVDVSDGEREHHLFFTDSGIAMYLKGGAAEGRQAWGTRMTDQEYAVRMLTITLEEDLLTRAPREDGNWIFDGGFEPGAPWER